MTHSEKNPIRYLRIVGHLRPDNVLCLMPAYLTTWDNDAFEPAESRLSAQCLDERGNTLLSRRLPVARYCIPGNEVVPLAVRAKIPFPAGTRAVRFRWDDVVVHTLEVSPSSPRVRLTWRPSERVEGRCLITWEASHPERRELQAFLRYSRDDGATWERVGPRTVESEQELDFERLPGAARCRLAVVVTDGANTVLAVSEPFSVAEKGCRPSILSPDDGSKITAGTTLILRGQAFDVEQASFVDAPLVWESSLEGKLAEGSLRTIALRCPGKHRLTLTAGEGARSSETSITVHVEAADGASKSAR